MPRKRVALVAAIAAVSGLLAMTPVNLHAESGPEPGELRGREQRNGTQVREPARFPDGARDGNLLERPRATGNWFGARSTLEDHGLTLEAAIVADWSRNLRGGLDTGDDAFRHLFSLNLEVQTQPLLGIEGGTFFLDFQNQDGPNASEELVGDFQVFSNIDEQGFTQVAELWYEQRLLNDGLRLKVGKVDANSEFAYVDHGVEFINSSPGFSPTILGFPTYPDPATSVNVFVNPRVMGEAEDQESMLYLGVGLYDGATQDGGFGRTGNRGPKTFFASPADLFLIGEVGLRYELGRVALPGRLGAGGWGHTGTFDRFDGGIEHGTAGFYVVVDQMLWREQAGAPEDKQGIGVFVQYGYADPDVAEADHHAGVGGVWTGLVPGRDEDVLGLMASYVHFSDQPGAGFTESFELAVETFYKAQITPWLALKPDLQYIVNPGGDEAVDDALVGTLRVEVAF